MLRALKIVEYTAKSLSNVLIQGETGTGKDLFARLIHQESRRGGNFVPINCGSISSSLMRSELFGHAKGAFTGAEIVREGLFRHADNGTAFLDEIGDLPLEDQVKLNRFIETRQLRPLGSDKRRRVVVKIVAATNVDLRQLVAQGKFRRDLFYRLNVIGVTLPPLRDRALDFRALVRFVSNKLIARGIQSSGLSTFVVNELKMYTWPGNIRELENVVERLMLLFPGGDATREEVWGQIAEVSVMSDATETPYPYESMTLAAMRDHHINRALEKAGGNRLQAAHMLGIDPKTLYNHLRAGQKHPERGNVTCQKSKEPDPESIHRQSSGLRSSPR